jgi:hypothetical protein
MLEPGDVFSRRKIFCDQHEMFGAIIFRADFQHEALLIAPPERKCCPETHE